MTVINSVLGPIHATDLGFTLMHEHIMNAPAGVSRDYPELIGGNLVERVVNDLKRAKEGGVDTIVDATTFDLGRDINLLVETSRQSGVNIIACTGWWLDLPRFLAGVSVDQFAQLFVREIQEGIAGTNVRPGILKAASDILGVTTQQETILRAVARAHLQTDVPIMLHSYAPGEVGKQQLAILKDEGVDLRRVKVDHSNDTTDVEYLTWLLEQGCYLGLDRYPWFTISSVARTKTMKTLIDAGYVGRLLPSNDHCLLKVTGKALSTPYKERTRCNPHGYLYIKKVVLPQLKEMGVSDAILNSLCIEGPRNFFEGI
jgi:phosphotriesterase-related protein